MHAFPISASDDEIKSSVVDWSELLAQQRFGDALTMFPPAAESEMTPTRLARWIANYGADDEFPDGRVFAVTSLRALPQFADIVSRRIEVDRENLYSLDPNDYVGMVHYSDVPLDGKPSDLTARFYIKQMGNDRITLEFLDIHVM